eukprot:3176013-Rhodomonas_salina.1
MKERLAAVEGTLAQREERLQAALDSLQEVEIAVHDGDATTDDANATDEGLSAEDAVLETGRRMAGE